jgi:hypothetical protein
VITTLVGIPSPASPRESVLNNFRLKGLFRARIISTHGYESKVRKGATMAEALPAQWADSIER